MSQDTIPGITDKVYVMGKAIEKKMEIDRNEKKKTYRQKIEKREQKRKKIKD